jgi:hypothetical protein
VIAVRTADAIDTACRLAEEVAECVEEGGANHVVVERDADATGSIENHEDHAKIKHPRRNVSHQRHCYLALALSTPAMNFSGHGRPTTTSFFTNGRWRSNSGDLFSNSGEGLLRRPLLPAFLSVER